MRRQTHDTRALEALLLRLRRAAHGLGARAGARARPARRSRRSAIGSRADLEARGSGLVLRNVAGGWRLYTHPDAAPVVEQFVLSSRQARLTKAALETLAIVAYKQPVTRHQVSGDPGRELRRRPARARRPRPDRGGGRDEAPGRPRALRDDAGVPRAARPALARLVALARPAPGRRRVAEEERARRRVVDAEPATAADDAPATRDEAEETGTPVAESETRLIRPDGRGTAPARPRARRLRLASNLRGADRRGPGHPRAGGSRPSATRSTSRPRPSRSTASSVNLDPNMQVLRAPQAAGRRDDDARPAGSAGHPRPASRPRARGCSRWADSTATPRGCCCSRTTATSRTA